MKDSEIAESAEKQEQVRKSIGVKFQNLLEKLSKIFKKSNAVK